MKPGWIILSIGALAAAFAVGRLSAPPAAEEAFELASFRRAVEDPDWLSRTHGLTRFLRGLSPQNLPAALEALEPQLAWLTTDELRLFMLAWSRFDPQAAFDRAMHWPPQYRRNGAGAALYAWAFRDPQAALEAMKNANVPEFDEFLEARLIAGWTHGEHIDTAISYIALLPQNPQRFAYVGTLAWELSKRGPEAVMNWADEAPAVLPRYRAAAFLKAASTLAPIDAPATARWLAGHMNQDYADGALRVVARSWAATDPLAAMEWLSALPAGAQRTGSIANAFRVWHDRSPERAESWLRDATPSNALDPAVRVMVGRSRHSSPRKAIDWAKAIADPARRAGVLAGLERGSAADSVDEQSWLDEEQAEPGDEDASTPTP